MNTPGYVAAVVARAEAGGVRGAELAALRRRLRQLGEQQAGLLPDKVLEPVADLPRLDELPQPSPGQGRDVLDRLVIVKLNGGLGTSMGLSGPKSLLEVKPGASFLDIVARQVVALRERHGRLRIWKLAGSLCCQVEDGEPLASEHSDHAGNEAAAAADASGLAPGHQLPSQPGHGLWLVRQIADRMRILSGARGTQATIAFHLPPCRKGQGCLQA